MNLLPKGTLDGPSRPRWPGPGAGLPLGLGAGLVAAALALAVIETRRLDAATAVEVAASGALQRRIAGIAGLRDQIEADRGQLARLRVLEGRLARWDEERWVLSDLLAELSVHVGDGVVLENLRRRGGEVWITGRTVSTGAARSAAGRFARIDRIRSLSLQYVERSADPAGAAPGVGNHRVALSGTLRFNSREPEPLGGGGGWTSSGGGGAAAR